MSKIVKMFNKFSKIKNSKIGVKGPPNKKNNKRRGPSLAVFEVANLSSALSVLILRSVAVVNSQAM